jgi:integrase
MSREKPRQYGSGSIYQRTTDGRWLGQIQAGWTERGTRRVVTVSAATEKDCRRKLDRKVAEMKAGSDITGASNVTVKTWSAEWLERHREKARPKYYATDASAVKVWIVPTIGHKRLDTLTPGDVRAVTKAMRAAGRSTTTAGYAQGVLERMLRAAIVEGQRVPPRILMLQAPGKAVHDRDAIPTDQAVALLKVAQERGDIARWAAALLQGMRQGECLGLTWDAVDLDDGTLDVSWQLQDLPYLDRAAGTFRIPDGYDVRRLHGAAHLVRPKSKKGHRVIPLVPWMTAALTEWQERAPASPHGLVWPRPDGRGQVSSADRAAWYDLQAVAGVAHPSGRPYYGHEARHATATLLLEAGVDPEVIKAILGHSSIVTSRAYQHVSQDLARKALADVALRLGLGTERPPAILP